MQALLAAATSQNRSKNLADRLAFAPPTSSYSRNSFPGELIFIPRSLSPSRDSNDDGVPCIFLPSQYTRFLVIYFHANGEDLGKVYPFLNSLRLVFKVHVLAVEYPGYGACSGRACEESVMANCTLAMRFAMDVLCWPCEDIKLFGRSIGTGPAMKLAAQYPVAGLILVTPFLSICEVIRTYVGSFADYATDTFQNYRLAGCIESQTLIIHGKNDSLVPVSHGLQIYEMLPGKKMMVCPEDMHHNTSLLDNVAVFVRPMTQFFSLPDFTCEDILLPEWVLPRDVPKGHDAKSADDSSDRQGQMQDQTRFPHRMHA
jgi:pimeloyl-ACP methyl ester carboxylesterase